MLSRQKQHQADGGGELKNYLKQKLMAFSERLQSSIADDLCKESKVIFGPFHSTKLGMCLGINNVKSKACTYNCIYCKSGTTSCCSVCCNTCVNPWNLYSCVRRKINELADNGVKIDAIAFIPDGETTLDSNIAAKIRLLRQLNVKIAVFTNSSLLWNYNVKQNLLFADFVSLKIDTVNEDTWLRINRPHMRLDHPRILDSIIEFSREFRGELVTETMLISDYNDTREEMEDLSRFLSQLKPAHSYFAVAAGFMKDNNRINNDPLKFLGLTDYITRTIPNAEITACEDTNYFIAASA